MNNSDPAVTETESTTSLLAAISLRREGTTEVLAAKQNRLLTLLTGSTMPERNDDLKTSEIGESPKEPRKLPPPPSRETFKTQEDFEESLGYWQENVGRIRAMVESAGRSKHFPPTST